MLWSFEFSGVVIKRDTLIAAENDTTKKCQMHNVFVRIGHKGKEDLYIEYSAVNILHPISYSIIQSTSYDPGSSILSRFSRFEEPVSLISISSHSS